MGNNLISPRNAKVFSYNSPDRTKVPSLLPDLTTVKLLIERQDWRGVQQILLDNTEWLLSPTSNGNGCMIAGKHPLHHALCVKAPKFIIETILKIDPSSVNRVGATTVVDEKGFQAIHFAVKYNNAVEVLALIISYDHMALEVLDGAGRLPLHDALLAANPLDVVTYLIGMYPVSIKVRTKYGAFPLHLALEGKCDIEVISYLIKTNPETVKQSYNSNLPLHVACGAKCSLEVFDLVLSNNENAILCYGEHSKPVLHFAVGSKCCIDIISKLIKLNSEVLLHRDKTARMPIHYAIENMINEDIIMLLMAECPQSVSCRGRGTPGDYPLEMAIQKHLSNKIILEMLKIYPAAVKQKSVFGMFPLRSALKEKCSLEIILAIIDLYPNAASESDEHGRVALHYAASRDAPIILIDALISSYPPGISKGDRNDQIPLHLACIRVCTLQLISLLLDRFRQGARCLDKYKNTPLNYIIENNASVEYYRLLVDADKKCMELFPPDPITKDQGKLSLHHAIEFQRKFEVIDFLAKAYPEGCQIPMPGSGKLALHLAILRPLPIDSLLSIEKEYPNAACIADCDGLYPVHHAIKMKTDSQLIQRLLISNKELTRLNHFPLHMKQSRHIDNSDVDKFSGELQECCQGNRLLIHYAIDEQTSPENVAEILKYTMPFEADSGNYFQEHYFTWTHILAHTNDQFWRSVEIVLELYNSATVTQLAEFFDEHRRKAIDIATPRCHSVILYRLHYYARYELPTVKSFHVTNSSMLKKGIDHYLGRKIPVVLKFVSCLESFSNELRLRENVHFDERFVVPLIQSHNGDEDYNYREESIRKRFQDFRYLLVLKTGNQSLEDIIRHDHIATNSSTENKPAKIYARQILGCLVHLHKLGVVHCNLTPSHIISFDGNLRIGDFALSSIASQSEKLKIAYGRRALGYCSPEVAQLHNREKVEESIPVSCSMDMWSFGAILYYLFTGEELFLTSFDGNIDNDQLELLIKWPLFAKTKRMKKINDPLARNLIEQLLSIEVRLRPSADECLSHPFFLTEDHHHASSVKSLCPIRYTGIPAMYDVFLSFRHGLISIGENDKDNRLQKIKKAKGINKYLVDDEVHFHTIQQHLQSVGSYKVMDSLIAADCDNDNDNDNAMTAENKAQERTHAANNEAAIYENIFRCLSNCKTFVMFLSRFAVNCDGLNIGTLLKTSPCHPFLFELRLALEFLSRGLIEGGLFVVAVGDLLPTDADEKSLDDETTSTISNVKPLQKEEWVYQPFFQHFQQEITLTSGNAFPEKLPNVVVEELEQKVATHLLKNGFGKLHHPFLSIKELFRQVLQMPTIHVQGINKYAIDAAKDDLLTALQQKIGKFNSIPGAGAFNSILSMSRPQTSAFQKMLDSRIPSPDFNRRAQVSWFKDREPLIPQSPLHNYSLTEIISQQSNNGNGESYQLTGSRGGLVSRGGIPSRHGRSSNGQSLTHSPSKLRQSLKGDDGDVEQDVMFFNNSDNTNERYTTNFQLHQQNQSNKSSLPFFTEIVSLDKATSEEMMHFLVEKMEVRDSEVNNLVLELTLMEERMRLQQMEIHRLRNLVQVTHTLDMEEKGEEDNELY